MKVKGRPFGRRFAVSVQGSASRVTRTDTIFWIDITGSPVGRADWLRAYRLKVRLRVRTWLSEVPDMSFEDDYVDHSIFPQGNEMSYFESLPVEVLHRLGVVIVKGEYTGSSYYAAELKKGIGEANAAAEAECLDLRFFR